MFLYKYLIFFFLLLVSSSSILAFRYSFFLFLKCLLASHRSLFRLSILLWFGSCNHHILACFLWSTKPKHSSHHGLSCFNSYRPWLSLPEVLIFSLMFTQALFIAVASNIRECGLSLDYSTLLHLLGCCYFVQVRSAVTDVHYYNHYNCFFEQI